MLITADPDFIVSAAGQLDPAVWQMHARRRVEAVPAKRQAGVVLIACIFREIYRCSQALERVYEQALAKYKSCVALNFSQCVEQTVLDVAASPDLLSKATVRDDFKFAPATPTIPAARPTAHIQLDASAALAMESGGATMTSIPVARVRRPSAGHRFKWDKDFPVTGFRIFMAC